MWFIKRSTTKTYPEEVIRQYSLQRLATVFGVPVESLYKGARFGQELKAAPASDFKPNELDAIDWDIKDVADKQLLKEMTQGLLVIETVNDYCDHMVRCSAIKPEEVARILGLPPTVSKTEVNTDTTSDS